MTDRPAALLLGGGVVAISVARGLARAGVEVIGFGHPADPIRHSRHCVDFVSTRTDDCPQEQWMEQLERRGGSGVLLPCCDDGLELLAGNRRRLQALGYQLPEADYEVVTAMLDKAETARIAVCAGVDVPRTVTIAGSAGRPAAVADFSFPCALKPRHSHRFARHFGMRRKLIVVDSSSGLEDELARLPDDLEMVLTEIVPGPDLFTSYYSYIDERGQPLFHYTKRKLRQYPTRFGLGCFHRADWDPETAGVGLRFLEAAGVRGFACVEFKRDERDNRLKLIECNHRLTAADGLLQACGLNAAPILYGRAIGSDSPPPGGFRWDAALWFPAEDARAFLEYRRARELSLGGWLRSLMVPLRFPVASLSDPLPGLIAGARLLGRGLRRLLPGGQGPRRPASSKRRLSTGTATRSARSGSRTR